jgi:hypothetical protein
MIGLFLAMLELIRQGMVRIEQDAPFSEIYLFLKVDIPDETPKTDGGEASSTESSQPVSVEGESAPAVTDSTLEEASTEPEPVPGPTAVPIEQQFDDDDDEENLEDLDIDQLAMDPEKDKNKNKDINKDKDKDKDQNNDNDTPKS